MTDRPANVLPGCRVLPPMDPRPNTTSTSTPKLTAKTATKEPQNKTTGDRFATINGFIDFTLAALSRNEAAVWLILWRDTKEGTARTAHTDIARRAGIGRRTVIRMVAKLVAKGLLVMVHRGGLNRGMNVYRVLPLAKPP